MAITINKLTNANIYLDGTSLAGQAEEVDLPKVDPKMVEHKGLGMAGTFELPSGFDKMEMRIKWNSFYQDAFAKVADPYSSRQFQVRGNLENYTGPGGRVGQVAYKATVRGTFKGLPGGNFKQNENVEMESMVNVVYFKLEIGQTAVYEFDVFANIYKVNGVDLLQQFRQNTGT